MALCGQAYHCDHHHSVVSGLHIIFFMPSTILLECLQNEPAGIVQNIVVTGTLGCSGDMNCDKQIEFVLMYSCEGTTHYVIILGGFAGFFTCRR